MKSPNQTAIQSKKFQSYHNAWLTLHGPDEASDFLAAHIGRLVARVDALEKQVKKLSKVRKSAYKRH